MSCSDIVDQILGTRSPSLSLHTSAVLAKAVCRAAVDLGLTPATISLILGTSHDFFNRVRAGETALDPLSVAGQRALLLVRLYLSLDLLVGHDNGNRWAWMQGHMRGLGGIPSRIILEPAGLEGVVAYLKGMETNW